MLIISNLKKKPGSYIQQNCWGNEKHAYRIMMDAVEMLQVTSCKENERNEEFLLSSTDLGAPAS